MKIMTFVAWEESPIKAAETASESYNKWRAKQKAIIRVAVMVNAYCYAYGVMGDRVAYFVHIITVQYDGVPVE